MTQEKETKTERNYSELEGKIVYFPDTAEGAANGRVIGCDPDIGITIVDLVDDNRFLLCLLGDSAPQRKAGGYKKDTHIIFPIIIRLIESGVIDYVPIHEVTFFGGSPAGPSQGDCAFGQ